MPTTTLSSFTFLVRCGAAKCESSTRAGPGGTASATREWQKLPQKRLRTAPLRRAPHTDREDMLESPQGNLARSWSPPRSGSPTFIGRMCLPPPFASPFSKAFPMFPTTAAPATQSFRGTTPRPHQRPLTSFQSQFGRPTTVSSYQTAPLYSFALAPPKHSNSPRRMPPTRVFETASRNPGTPGPIYRTVASMGTQALSVNRTLPQISLHTTDERWSYARRLARTKCARCPPPLLSIGTPASRRLCQPHARTHRAHTLSPDTPQRAWHSTLKASQLTPASFVPRFSSCLARQCNTWPRPLQPKMTPI
jgi:hypothetical protein